MKFRNTIAIIIAVALGLISIQSSRYSPTPEKIKAPQSYFKGYSVRAALCVPLIDTAADITALSGWGNYKWKISGASDSAQYFFNQGISMYYAFHSIEAIASFTKATHLNPNCAMAWYGKALAMGPTINYPNGYRPPSGALEAALKSKALSAGCTPVEKDLIEAIQQRYNADTTIVVLQLRTKYAEAMQSVYEKHKTNADVVTLYADALMLLHPWDLYFNDFKPKPWEPKIRSLLEQAIAISPKHPGANHYYIHAVEGSATPGLATNSGHLLDTLMPQVSHLTHMPSHIYIRTGDYSRGIKDNDSAVAGYAGYLKRYAPVENGFALYQAHNIHMKINCAQLAGSYKISMDASKELQSHITPALLALKSADGNYMQFLYTQGTLTNVRFGKWDDIIKTLAIDSLPYTAVLQHFARGIAFSRTGNLEMAKKELNLFNNGMQNKSLKYTMDNSNTAYDAANVARLILLGVVAEGEKQYGTAISYLREAVKTEDNLLYSEPRDWPIPARQYLAQVLLKTGKYTEAIAVLNRDLFINPKNGWALTGLQTAYVNTNNSAELQKIKPRLKSAWKIKDMPIGTPVF